MEAVWKRILLLLVVGVMLTLIVFPIVRGEPDNIVSNTSSGEKMPTIFKEVYIGPVDRSSPPDGMIDLYENHPEEWVFTYQLLTMDENGSYEVIVTYAKVWFVISMGKYENTTKAMTDLRGRVHFNYTRRFTDTLSGALFEFEKGEWYEHMTISIEFYGDNDHFGTIRTRECLYQGDQPHDYPTREERVEMILDFMTHVYAMMVIFIGIGSLLFYGIFSWMVKELKRWEWKQKMSEREPIPRFNTVRLPSVSCPAGPFSPRP